MLEKIKQLVVPPCLVQYLRHPKGVFEGMGYAKESLREWKELLPGLLLLQQDDKISEITEAARFLVLLLPLRRRISALCLGNYSAQMLLLVAAQSVGKGFGQPFLRRINLTGARQHFDLDCLDSGFVKMLVQLPAMSSDVLGRPLGIALHECEGETRDGLIQRCLCRIRPPAGLFPF